MAATRQAVQHVVVSVTDHLAAVAAHAGGPAGQGDPRGAATSLATTLSSAQAQIGKDHPTVLVATRVLAGLRRQLGELSEARTLLENALAAGQFTRGEGDVTMLGLAYDLALIAYELENRHEARRNFERIRRFGPAVLGVEHEYVQAAYRFLGGPPPVAPPPAAPPLVAPAQVAPPPAGPVVRATASVRPVSPAQPAAPPQAAPPQAAPPHVVPAQPSAPEPPAAQPPAGGPAAQVVAGRAAVPARPVEVAQPDAPPAPDPADDDSEATQRITPAPTLSPATTPGFPPDVVDDDTDSESTQRVTPQPIPAQRAPAPAGPAPAAQSRWLALNDPPAAQPAAPPAAQPAAPPPAAPVSAPPPNLTPEPQPDRHPVSGAPAHHPVSGAPAHHPVSGVPVSPAVHPTSGTPASVSAPPAGLDAPVRRVPAHRHGSAPTERRRSRVPLVLLVIVLTLAVLGGAAALVVTFLSSKPDPGPGPGRSATPTGAAAIRLTLEDRGASVTLTWTDPSNGGAAFVISYGRADGPADRTQQVRAGVTTAAVNQLNPAQDYCFTVAGEPGAGLTPSPSACTRRARPSTSASGTGGGQRVSP
jgi:hypothetical protein